MPGVPPRRPLDRSLYRPCFRRPRVEIDVGLARDAHYGERYNRAMSVRAFNRIRLGYSNAYILGGEGGCVLVDAGGKNKDREIVWFLGVAGIPVDSIKLIVVTHVHEDHVGGLRGMQGLCCCPVLVHEAEADRLRSGKTSLPRGIGVMGKAISAIGNTLGIGGKFAPVEPDVVVSSETLIGEYGVAARVIPTPGHTDGSLSVLLPGGDAVVGDLVANIFPYLKAPGLPPFVDDMESLLRSWKLLLDEGAKTISPGHGVTFSADQLWKAYHKLRNA
ncbi:MAG: MBL fold metallo-hydrolase [Chloroflexi bacterium]|nr:MBL fold metallo-hydrolase [Chloroflexota bacterium]